MLYQIFSGNRREAIVEEASISSRIAGYVVDRGEGFAMAALLGQSFPEPPDDVRRAIVRGRPADRHELPLYGSELEEAAIVVRVSGADVDRAVALMLSGPEVASIASRRGTQPEQVRVEVARVAMSGAIGLLPG